MLLRSKLIKRVQIQKRPLHNAFDTKAKHYAMVSLCLIRVRLLIILKMLFDFYFFSLEKLFDTYPTLDSLVVSSIEKIFSSLKWVVTTFLQSLGYILQIIGKIFFYFITFFLARDVQMHMVGQTIQYACFD